MTKLSDEHFFSIPFKGQTIEACARITPFPKSRIYLKDNSLLDVAVSSAQADHVTLAGHARTQVMQWLRAQARKSLCDQVEQLKGKYGFDYKSLAIKDTRSRWGSCSSHGGLNFSWRLILAPEEVLNYVVVHETAHLQELNHSASFWEIVRNRFPEFNGCKAWLKNNGSRLMAWDLTIRAPG